MIVRRYGTSFESVEMDFDAKALNEITFRRNRKTSIPVEELESFETVETVELSEEASGDVQAHTEQAMLDKLSARIEQLLASLDGGALLVVENEPGHDYPKPRQTTKNVVVGGENRLYFEYTMAPPLRISIRRPSS